MSWIKTEAVKNQDVRDMLRQILELDGELTLLNKNGVSLTWLTHTTLDVDELHPGRTRLHLDAATAALGRVWKSIRRSKSDYEYSEGHTDRKYNAAPRLAAEIKEHTFFAFLPLWTSARCLFRDSLLEKAFPQVVLLARGHRHTFLSLLFLPPPIPAAPPRLTMLFSSWTPIWKKKHLDVSI